MGNLLQGHKVTFLSHVYGLEGAVQPHPDLLPAGLLIAGVCVRFAHQDFTGVAEEYSAVSQVFDCVDRALDFELVLAGVELLV